MKILQPERIPNPFLILFAIGSALIMSATCARAEGTIFLDPILNQNEIQVTSDIWYGAGSPDTDQRFFLDVYKPTDSLLPQELPALVYIHGGAFVLGDKADQPAPVYCYEFARRGYVVFSINYTLDGSVDSAVLDAAKAVRWVRQHAQSYNIDPDRIIIGGHSAGAVTSLNLGALEADDLGGPGAEVAGILNAAGSFIADLTELDINDPPMFIINGTLDTLAPVENARDLASWLELLNIEAGYRAYAYDYMEIEGAGHSFIPGNGLGVAPPPFAGSPQDATQGWSNTEVDGKTVERHCFEFFFRQLHLAEFISDAPVELRPSFDHFSNAIPIGGGEDLTGEGWIWSLNYKLIYLHVSSPWTYSPTFGWAYSVPSIGPEGNWFFLSDVDRWFWTADGIFPHLYDYSNGRYAFIAEVDGIRFLYDYSVEAWLQISG